MAPEVAHRCKTAKQAGYKLRKPELEKSELSHGIRCHAERACIASRLLHGAGAWDPLQEALGQKLAGTQVRSLAAIVGVNYANRNEVLEKWPDSLVRARTGRLSMPNQLRVARLQYLPLASRGARILLALLQESAARIPWKAEIVRDLQHVALLLSTPSLSRLTRTFSIQLDECP